MSGPVFVTGTSRSGTTVLSACLGRSDSLYIGAETHYFDDLRPRLGERAPTRLAPDDQARCERYFMALAHGVYGTPAAEAWGPQQDTPEARVERASLVRLADELGGSADAWFEAFCRLQAERQGASRWGEKTPRHVFRIPDMLGSYPDARVVCMVRDPRAVAASYGGFSASAHKEGRRRSPEHASWAEEDRERIRRSHHPLLVAMLWRATLRAAQRALAEHGPERVRILRFEALLEDPMGELSGLCGWLDVPFREEMITSVPQINSSFVAMEQGRGISRDAAERWRESLKPTEIAAVQQACGPLLEEAGYEPVPVGASTLRAGLAWASLPLAAIRAFTANRGRFGNGVGYVTRRLRLALGGRR